MQAAQMRALFGDSKYADRLPIGLPEVLKTFPAQRLRDFYRDFYRADRMAVVAVGDFDPARIEALIREHFGSLPTPAARDAAAVSGASCNRTRATWSVSDPEAQGSSVTRRAQAAAARRATPPATTGSR